MSFHDAWLILTVIGAIGFVILGINLRTKFGVRQFKMLFTLTLLNYISIALEQICADIRATLFNNIDYFSGSSIALGLVGRGLEVVSTFTLIWYVGYLFKLKNGDK